MNLKLSAAMLAVGALLLALAGPVAAAPTGAAGGTSGHAQLVSGVVCGAVTAYTPPALGTDGSITIGGVTDPVDATATVSTQATAALTATLPLTTCLNLTVSGGEVTGIAIATSGQICGPVTATGTGAASVFSIGGAIIPSTAVNAELAALLNAAVTANAEVCVDLTVDANTGAVTAAANLDATFQLCARVTASGTGAARTYTVGGLAIPAAQLSAADAATLELALTNDANACVDLAIVNSQITSATAMVDVCVTVSAVTATSITLDGVVIPLAAGSTVASDVRAGATLGVRVAVNATSDAVTVSVVTLPGCAAAAAAGGGAMLPNTSVTPPASVPVMAILGAIGVLGALGLGVRRRAACAA